MYTDYTEIKVEVPQGSKCYYTIADGSAKPADPDASSNLYIADETQYKEVYGETKEEFKPLEMLRGTHIMKFVLIDGENQLTGNVFLKGRIYGIVLIKAAMP